MATPYEWEPQLHVASNWQLSHWKGFSGTYSHNPLVTITLNCMFIALFYIYKEIWNGMEFNFLAWYFMFAFHSRVVQRHASCTRYLCRICGTSRILSPFHLCHCVYGSMEKGFHSNDFTPHSHFCTPYILICHQVLWTYSICVYKLSIVIKILFWGSICLCWPQVLPGFVGSSDSVDDVVSKNVSFVHKDGVLINKQAEKCMQLL